jgi:hypothetical protein
VTERELAWAAGLFEGEGSIRIGTVTPRNLGVLIATITSTDRETIDYFAERWPGKVGAATGLRPTQRRAWRWTIAARQAAAFLEDIEPYVVTARVREKLELGLAFQRQKLGRAGNRAPGYADAQREFYGRMRALNVRGAS